MQNFLTFYATLGAGAGTALGELLSTATGALLISVVVGGCVWAAWRE